MFKMNLITCIIVDDEPLALDLMEKFVMRTSFLKLLGCYDNAIDALDAVRSGTIHLIFLDIQMPELNGIEFSQAIDKNSKVIFTTAFNQYALDGFRVNALDYLLKPFNYAEFLAAAEKAQEWFAMKQDSAAGKYIFVRSEYKLIKIILSEVLCFESMKDYVKIWRKSAQRPTLTLMSLKSLESILRQDKFMRIHRSFIIALDEIQAIEHNHVVLSDSKRIAIAEQYKATFFDFINRNCTE
jgi:DNA-binding LytR/AlgR family response regulator